MAVSFQCMTKFTTNKKKKERKQEWKKKKRKIECFNNLSRLLIFSLIHQSTEQSDSFLNLTCNVVIGKNANELSCTLDPFFTHV